MISLLNFSRFPIFYSSNGKKILGSRCNSKDFEQYVYSCIKITREPAVCIYSLENIEWKRRFIIRDRAINPQLRTREKVPRKIFVYNDYEPDEAITDALTLGIILKGVREGVYIPLIELRVLEEEEVLALERTVKIKEQTIERMLEFLRAIGCQVNTRVVSRGIIVEVHDRIVDVDYRVLIDERGRVIDTDFCIEFEDLYLTELALLVRERGRVFHTHWDYL